jgi:acrylyl-CoA reductase (NADPH)
MFNALVLEKTPEFSAMLRPVDDDFLSPGDVTIAVDYSTINFKDALAITNRSPIVRTWPMIAGIDAAGSVVESAHADWRAGDRVVVNGWGIGESHTGGLAERARLKGDWLVRLPEGFTPRQAMAIGTAGYTAMLCVLALERYGIRPGDGDVLVTGATGGVGSVAVAILARLGHRVVAATGKTQEAGYLKSLGAADIIDRAELSAPGGKPLQKERWAAVVDAVGSHTLANAMAQVRYGGAVAACGLAQGADFPATVMPLILRNVAVLGVCSVQTPMPLRREAWTRLASDLDPALLDSITSEVTLAQAIDAAQRLLAGQVRGRIVVRIAG